MVIMSYESSEQLLGYSLYTFSFVEKKKRDGGGGNGGYRERERRELAPTTYHLLCTVLLYYDYGCNNDTHFA